MAIFLDSGDINEIKKFKSMGIISGVTTNPTILSRDGIQGNLEDVKSKIVEIARLIFPYPLSVELVTNERKDMLEQALSIQEWMSTNSDTYLAVKIPIHGPEGESNLETIKHASKEGIIVNATAMMSAQQCILAALSGAFYVSLFGGRTQDMGFNATEEIRKLRNILDKWDMETRIIMGSSREVINIVEWFDAGAHIVTVAPKLLDKMIVNPFTKETVRQFLRDANGQ